MKVLLTTFVISLLGLGMVVYVYYQNLIEAQASAR